MNSPNPSPARARWRGLIERHLHGDLTADEARELETALGAHREAREEFRRCCNVDAALHREAMALEQDSTAEAAASPGRAKASSGWFAWFSWRPLTAAAAGLVIGLFCASVVFAYVAPSLGKVVSLLDESFESGPAPLVTGVPVVTDRWSGDYSEVVGEQQGVKPETGKKILRILRADYEGKPNSEQSQFGDVFRLIDMRPHRAEFADGGAVVQLSAGFNALEFPADERYSCTLTLCALDADTATNGSTRSGVWRDDMSLAMQRQSLRLDRNPATWQRLTSELRLPPDTDFLLVRIVIGHPPSSPAKEVFSGHYLDDVRLVMARRNPLP